MLAFLSHAVSFSRSMLLKGQRLPWGVGRFRYVLLGTTVRRRHGHCKPRQEEVQMFGTAWGRDSAWRKVMECEKSKALGVKDKLGGWIDLGRVATKRAENSEPLPEDGSRQFEIPNLVIEKQTTNAVPYRTVPYHQKARRDVFTPWRVASIEAPTRIGAREQSKKGGWIRFPASAASSSCLMVGISVVFCR